MQKKYPVTPKFKKSDKLRQNHNQSNRASPTQSPTWKADTSLVLESTKKIQVVSPLAQQNMNSQELLLTWSSTCKPDLKMSKSSVAISKESHELGIVLLQKTNQPAVYSEKRFT